jgi:uncharacterized protein YjgD (DUF1641 family)
MAKPQRSYPESATKGGREESTAEGREALQDALGKHGDDLAAAVERTDEVDELLTTAILVLATAEQEDVENVTETLAALVRAGDGLATEETADLAAEVGENADDLAGLLDTGMRLEREADLDAVVTLAGAASSSLSDEDVERLADLVEEGGEDVVDTLELAVELQREGDIDQLLETAKVLSVLEIDEDAARGLNSLLSAVGEAERESEPVGLLGALGQLRSRDGRAGLGYLLSLLKGLGRGGQRR